MKHNRITERNEWRAYVLLDDSFEFLLSDIFETDNEYFYYFLAGFFDCEGCFYVYHNSGKVRLVLDLRGNPGGYLDAAVDMASFFLPAGKTIVKEDFGTKADPVIYQSKGYDVFNENLKFVILVDGGSASASEILAGALQEQGKAKLVGVKTFGKGSVQELIPITKDTNLKVTIAKWLTPKGNSISESGLTPDFQVKMTDKDLKDGTDPQMAKAIELLK